MMQKARLGRDAHFDQVWLQISHAVRGSALALLRWPGKALLAATPRGLGLLRYSDLKMRRCQSFQHGRWRNGWWRNAKKKIDLDPAWSQLGVQLLSKIGRAHV